MKVLFMVRRIYFDAIVTGTKDFECRRATKRWLTVASHLNSGGPGDGCKAQGEAVFLCGRRVHRRTILETLVASSFESVFQRKLSAQGLKDIGRGKVVVFILGKELRP